MGKQIDYNHKTYYFKDENIDPINFISFKGPFHNVENSNISIEKIEENQK